MTPYLPAFILLLLVACMKSGIPENLDNNPVGTWKLMSQEVRDSTGHVEGRMDYASEDCPHFLVVTKDSVSTIATRSANESEAKKHSNCYFRTAEAYLATGMNEYASASNPFVKIVLQEGRLMTQRDALVIGRGQKKEILNYQRLKGMAKPDLSPCSCD